MANLGNLVAAGISARNENTLALANLNFDFSLVKVDAPKEFLQLGKALSPWRRKNAEEGSTHRTARKLGALFEQVADPPEGLVTAYGRRASEISQALDARQAGKQLGLFSDHAGADATVLWAAAVSGKTAIAVALLACMLARIWDAPKATSIWDELVQKRKEQIQQNCDGSELSHQALVAASRQDITRRELAEWDASARSWLDIADRVKETEHRKMEAVLLRLSLPVDTSTDVFTSVVRVWKTTMMAMDNLCKGVPQRVHNGAVLLAITSWHLYPDVDVFGGEAKYVAQNDVLVSPAGRLTVGLEDADPESASNVHWSLSLANLRFYGDPVLATSHARDASRISFQELTLIYLGSLFAAWKCEQFDPHFDQEKGARLVLALRQSLERIASKASVYTPKRHARYVLSYQNHWLSILSSAASKLLESNKGGDTTARKLVSLGTRQGYSLLQRKTTNNPPPCFGLLDARNWPQFALDGRSVHLLRELASKSTFKETSCRAIIHLGSVDSEDDDQFTTVFPWEIFTQHNERLYSKHVRWIPNSNISSLKPVEDEWPSSEVRTFSPHDIQKHGSTICWAPSLWGFQLSNRPLSNEVDELYRLLGDEVTGLYIHPDDASNWKWSNKKSAQQRIIKPVDMSKDFAYNMALEDVVSLLEADLINVGLLILLIHQSSPFDDFQWRPTDSGGGAAWSVYYAINNATPNTVARPEKHTPQTVSHKVPGPGKNNLDEKDECETSDNSELDDREINIGANWKELPRLWERDYLFNTITDSAFPKSMVALSIAADIWSYLPDASISLNVIRHSLFAAPWLMGLTDNDKFPEAFGKIQDGIPAQERARTFSCIIFLETGDLDISPSQLGNVFAISIRNTIYAAASLFADPYTICSWREVRMIYGNVGRPGVSMMIPPANPQLRKPNLETWRLINHETFTANNQCDDMFSKTSLHLSFTGYEQPFVAIERHGARDLEAYYLETVVTVFDGRERVGDLDILHAFDVVNYSGEPGVTVPVLNIVSTASVCPHSLRPSQCPRWIVVASWEELLEMPSGKVCIVRAHGNALSRLAASVVCVQNGVSWCFLLPPNPCYYCVEEQLEERVHGKSVALIC
ncbi:hypothetical protein F5Y09DRAFT_296095 [Xylaria sp. FL1042]|nr:hypothetical protein F5Y09DRAFT_296095 [Xylaria sp. FL1042]